MNFVAEEDAERLGLLADPGRLLDEAVLSFFEEVEVAALPESPRITGGELPAEGHAPKHRDDLDPEFGAQIQQPQDVILGPLLDFVRRLLRHIGGDERPDGRAAGPGGGVDPERAVRGDAVEAELGFGKGSLDLLGGFEALIALDHEVGGLRAGGAGLLGVIQELRETFGAVLGTFDTGMETIFGHSILSS